MSDSTASALVTPGAMVGGKYRLDALIGEGGMGAVWSATHLGLNQAVAIKFISREFVRSAEALRRFDSEAKAAAALKSRHVVQVFDTGTLADETPYIAMELLHGESLQSRVHRGGPVPLGEAVEILTQCSKALGRAHAAGIIHRDIKPDNIFLAQSNDDDSYLVKILDFGVAKMGSSPNEQGSQGATRTGAVLGTPLYMSPEQARGLKTIDQRTDLYSLGLVAYTMFTGNLAFSSESFGDLLLQICTAPLPQLCAGAPWLPPTMEAWFARACAREPQDRYASAQEFADGLRAAAGSTMLARGPSLADVQGRGLPGSPSGNSHVFASTGTSSGISRTGEVVVPAGGNRQLGIAVAIVSLLVGGAIVAAIVAFGRTSGGPAHPAASGTAGTTTQSPVVTATATATVAVDRLPALEASSTAGAAGTAATTAPTHAESLPATPPQPSHAVGGTHVATPPTPHTGAPGPAPANTVDLGY
ncbi:MAG: serine/threonine protein kinase [Polyangiaceae bacterium]